MNILNPRLLEPLPHQQHTYTRPDEEQNTECEGDEPVYGRELIRASEHGM